jgi:hypothetical protein
MKWVHHPTSASPWRYHLNCHVRNGKHHYEASVIISERDGSASVHVPDRDKSGDFVTTFNPAQLKKFLELEGMPPLFPFPPSRTEGRGTGP